MKAGVVLFGLLGTAAADFYFMISAGTDETGPVNAPGFSGQCGYAAAQSTTNICDITEGISPADNKGGCPGMVSSWPDFCGITLTGTTCPTSYQLDPSDDCGAAADATTGNGNPGEGVFYANVIDTANNNAMVGRCVYGPTNATLCAYPLGDSECEMNVLCYTTMYGTTAC